MKLFRVPLFCTLAILVLLACSVSVSEAASRRTSSRRVKTNGRSQSNRNTSAQSQSNAHHAAQSAPKPAAPPGSIAAQKTHVAPASAPVAPAAPQGPPQKPTNYGWNVNNNNGQKPAAGVGAPPAYPGLGHNYAAPGGAPPAYSPYHQRQAGSYQSSHGNPYNSGVGYPQQGPPSYNPYMQHGMGGGYGGPPMMGGGGYGGHGYGGHGGFGGYGGYGGAPVMGGGMYGGMMGGGGGGMMMGYPQQKKSSLFSLSNVLTGVALYGMYRSMTGGFGGYGSGYGHSYNNYGPREVHIYDHREHKPSNPDDLKPILGTVGLPQSVTGEKIELKGQTMEQVESQTKTPLAPFPPSPAPPTSEANATDPETKAESSVPDALPPLPFDDQPKIFFGYGYAYGYQNATVEFRSAKDGSRVGANSSTTAIVPSGNRGETQLGPEVDNSTSQVMISTTISHIE